LISNPYQRAYVFHMTLADIRARGFDGFAHPSDDTMGLEVVDFFNMLKLSFSVFQGARAQAAISAAVSCETGSDGEADPVHIKPPSALWMAAMSISLDFAH
jgi:hypothetical protein